jgi:oligopeptide/dipeptide ABC transporter ATP-binding protein
MYAGQIVEQASTPQLFTQVRMPYTEALFEAIPRLERPAHSPLPVIGGRPPDLSALPAGCSFAPRCRRAADDCRTTAPPLAEHEPGHRWACWHPVGHEGSGGMGSPREGPGGSGGMDSPRREQWHDVR